MLSTVGGNNTQAIALRPEQDRHHMACLDKMAYVWCRGLVGFLNAYFRKQNQDGSMFRFAIEDIKLFGAEKMAVKLDGSRLYHFRRDQLVCRSTLDGIAQAVGLPVLVNDRPEHGIIYVFDISPKPVKQALPKLVNFDASTRPTGACLVGFGVGATGAYWREIDDIGHLLVAGSTDSGKSSFLRSLVYQLARYDVELYMADMEGLTFEWARSWPQTKMLAEDVRTATEMSTALMGELERRRALYQATGRFPEKLAEYNKAAGEAGAPQLARIVVLVDEFTPFCELAGPNSVLFRNLVQLAQRSRKYGFTLVFAGQDFKGEVVNSLLSNQLKTRLQFRCATPAQSRVVLGDGCAASINTQGRAYLKIDGRLHEVQAFYVPKESVTTGAQVVQSDVLTPVERKIAAFAVENGKIDNSAVRQIALGCGDIQKSKVHPARAFLRLWASPAFGYLVRAQHGYKPTEKLVNLVSMTVRT